MGYQFAILLVFGISFLLPVISPHDVIYGDLPKPRRGDVIVGYEAARMVGETLVTQVREHGVLDDFQDLGQLLWFNLANPLYLAGLAMALRRRWWTSTLFGAAGTYAAAHWILKSEIAPHLQVGYWVWLGAIGTSAFASLATALLGRAEEAT
ncbi:MAG: hypothetical protein CMJ83_20185 [Planctomycetes bacterium]|nr:hypothetical protein [Planctomycetota bacterium]